MVKVTAALGLLLLLSGCGIPIALWGGLAGGTAAVTTGAILVGKTTVDACNDPRIPPPPVCFDKDGKLKK